MQKRTLFIGDVHGCYDELISLLEKIELSDEDELYFVGDLINKGPKSFEVVDFIRNRPNTFSVIGNHEYFLMQSEAPVLLSREQSWVDSAHLKASLLREELQYHREWLLSLPHIIERDDFIVVHGGIHPRHGIETPKEVATLIRLVEGTPWYELYSGEKPIIYGHWAVDGLRIRSNTIGLDTGCCFGGHLTAYCLESREVWQVRANDVYKEPGHWGGRDE